MGSIVTGLRSGWLSANLLDKGQAQDLQIYAPSLADLPQGSPLVLASLPVINWNDCLLEALRTHREKRQLSAYAAMAMVDPFACWEDFADALRDRDVTGVINFPPASVNEQPPAGGTIEPGQDLELRRLEWFGSLGFRTIFASFTSSIIPAAKERLKMSLDGILHVQPAALEISISDRLELVTGDAPSTKEHALPLFELAGRRA